MEVLEPEPVRPDAAGDGREHARGVLVALAQRMGARQRQRCGQTRAVGARPLGELRPELRVPGDVRGPRRVDQQVGRDLGARVEQQPGNPQRVAGPEPLALADRLGHAQPVVTGAQDRELLPQHLAVQRMREPHAVPRRRR